MSAGIEKKLHLELSTHRIEALSDGVFAIVMTILVLDFDILKPGGVMRGHALVEDIVSQWPVFLHFVESFVILSFFWTKHHQQFHFIEKTDRQFLWLNLFSLMFLCLIPFSTSLMSDFGDQSPAAIFFALNMLAVGAIYYFQWVYATSGCRLVHKDMDQMVVSFYKRMNLVIPALSVASIIVSFFIPRAGTFLYMMLPFMILMKPYRMVRE